MPTRLHIWVRLRSFETGIGLLEIEDDGLGFDVAAVNKSYDKRGSLGMVNLRERAELVNGLLNIDSAPGNGTRCKSIFRSPRKPQIVCTMHRV